MKNLITIFILLISLVAYGQKTSDEKLIVVITYAPLSSGYSYTHESSGKFGANNTTYHLEKNYPSIFIGFENELFFNRKIGIHGSLLMGYEYYTFEVNGSRWGVGQFSTQGNMFNSTLSLYSYLGSSFDLFHKMRLQLGGYIKIPIKEFGDYQYTKTLFNEFDNENNVIITLDPPRVSQHNEKSTAYLETGLRCSISYQFQWDIGIQLVYQRGLLNNFYKIKNNVLGIQFSYIYDHSKLRLK